MAANGIGAHKDELKKLDIVFAKIAPAVKGFAKKRHLLIAKYYHDTSSWNLMFRRKSGGIAMIQIILAEPNMSVFFPDTMKTVDDLPSHIKFKISVTYWMDDYDTEISRSQYEAMGIFQWSVKYEESSLYDFLEKAFQKILSWKLCDLTKQSGPHQWKTSWKTKAEFEKANASALVNGKVTPLPVV